MAETNTQKKENQSEFEVLEDKLYFKKQTAEKHAHYRLYISHSLVQELIQAYHENPLSRHAGIFKTYKCLYEVAYWPGMWADVKKTHQKPAGNFQQKD